MSLLTIVQAVADESGLPRPGAVVSSSDQQVRQLFALVNRSGQQLARRYDWAPLRKEGNFTTLAAELQGTLVACASASFLYFVNDTMWNRTLNRSIPGPLTAEEYQTLKANNASGPYPQFFTRESRLYFIPAPAAGESVYFEYISKYWCTDSTGATGKEKMNADTDISLVPENLVELDVLWRWRKKKGFDYSEEFREFETALANHFGRDGARTKLSMNGPIQNRGAIRVPEGSWTP